MIVCITIAILIWGSLAVPVLVYLLLAIKFFAQMLVIHEQHWPGEKKLLDKVKDSLKCSEFLWIEIINAMNLTNNKESSRMEEG